MAELVELRIERGIPELLQMERVNLFSSEEVKAIVKKRKAFEYRLQKSEKRKDDYLKYIAYEQSVLKLIKIRRKKIGYTFKYKEIEQAIAARIGALFRAIVYKKQEDVQLWLSFIQFSKEMNWGSQVGALYLRMLQVHSKKEAIWVAAAKWELENNDSPDLARKLLQRGLRHVPDSKLLWTEYFRMELLYTENIQRRRDIVLVQEAGG